MPGRRARWRGRRNATMASSTVTTTSATIRRRSTRCSTRRAMSVTPIRGSSPSLPPRTRPSSQPGPRRWSAPSSSGHRLLSVGIGAALPAGSGSAGHLARRVVATATRYRPAGEGARDVARRHLWRAGDSVRRCHPASPDHVVRALSSRGSGHQAAQRCPHPRGGHRLGP